MVTFLKGRAMRFYLLIFSFLLLNNTQGALIETDFSDLPLEITYMIFNCSSYKIIAKFMLLSREYNEKMGTYLLSKQEKLLRLGKNFSNAQKKQIFINNQLLRRYITNNKQEILNEEIRSKKLDYEIVKYFLNNTKTLEYKTCLTHGESIFALDKEKIDFLEWHYIVQKENNVEHVSFDTEKAWPISQIPYVQVLFSIIPEVVLLPLIFKNLKIDTPMRYFGFPGTIKPVNYSDSSLSVKLFIDETTKNSNFNSLSRLVRIKKLTLHFFRAHNTHKDICITCPSGLKKLVLLDCFLPVKVPPSVKSFKNISPKKGCEIIYVETYPPGVEHGFF